MQPRRQPASQQQHNSNRLLGFELRRSWVFAPPFTTLFTTPFATLLAPLLATLLATLTACSDSKAELEETGTAYAAQWLLQTDADSATEQSCHAFGLLKFPEVGCAEMLAYASEVDPASRIINRVRALACFGEGTRAVCGEFVELQLEGVSNDGIPIEETLVVKRDNNIFKMYWYRSTLIAAALQAAQIRREASTPAAQQQAAQAALEGRYNQWVTKDPALYSYPVCIDVRVTSRNKIGDLINVSELSAAEIDRRAAQCGGDVCLTQVGTRVAAICDAT